MFGYRMVKNYLNIAYHPVETALSNHDDLVHVLVNLGASVNIGQKKSMDFYCDITNRRTLGDWIQSIINVLENQINSCCRPKPSAIPIPESSGWQKFYIEYHESLKPQVGEGSQQEFQKATEREERERLEKLKDTKAYVLEVKQLLDEHGAKTWKEVYPDVESSATVTPLAIVPDNLSATVPPSKVNLHSYMVLTSGCNAYGTDTVSEHLLSSYDELYEACFVGDNEKIQSLCLPAEGAKSGSILLNISVKLMPTDFYNPQGKGLPVL